MAMDGRYAGPLSAIRGTWIPARRNAGALFRRWLWMASRRGLSRPSMVSEFLPGEMQKHFSAPLAEP